MPESALEARTFGEVARCLGLLSLRYRPASEIEQANAHEKAGR